MYLITFFVLLPERIPTSIVPFLVIIGFYVFIGVILRISKPTEETGFEELNDTEIYNSKFFFKLYGFFLILTIVFCLIPPIAIIFAIIIFIGIFLIAPFFFVLFLIKGLKGKQIEAKSLCSNCGNPVKPTTNNFCEYCGEKLNY